MQKLTVLTVHLSILTFALLPFISSSQELTEAENISKGSKHIIHETIVHGFILWASMGFLMPVGILVIRMTNGQECGRKRKIILYIHAILQIVSVLLATVGAIMSIRSFENSFNNNHQRIGLFLYGAIWLQVITSVLRPDRGSKGRSLWFSIHWLLGTTLSLLGILNIYTGLQAYHTKTLRGIRFWNWAFTIEITVIVFIYLLQEKWDYIKKEGVVLANEPVQQTDQETSRRDKKREPSPVLSTEIC